MMAVSTGSIPRHSFAFSVHRDLASEFQIMLGILPPEQIEDVLKKTVIGRIGCSADGETYVVPTSYVYDGKEIICHGYEGKKMAMMRKNPRVCFETEEMTDMAHWRSVVVQGRFEEVKDKEERNRAMHALLNRYLPVISSVTTHLGKLWPFNPDDVSGINGIVFRIVVNEKSGRFESSDESPYLPDS